MSTKQIQTRKSGLEAIQPAAYERLRYFEQQLNQIVETIRELVEIESPSDDKPAVDAIASVLAAKFDALSGRTQLHRSLNFGDSLQVDFSAP